MQKKKTTRPNLIYIYIYVCVCVYRYIYKIDRIFELWKYVGKLWKRKPIDNKNHTLEDIP